MAALAGYFFVCLGGERGFTAGPPRTNAGDDNMESPRRQAQAWG